MKNLSTKIAATFYVILFILIVISGTKKVMANDQRVVAEIKDQSPIKNILIKGNVEVFLTQGSVQNIKVYNDYYAANALTQIENGTLRISSFEKEKLTVWVTVNDLNSIEAYDYAVVYGTNQFKLLSLAVTLGNHAELVMDVQSYELNTAIADSSKLKLKGETTFYNVTATNEANIDISKFTAQTETLRLKDKSSITLNHQQNFKAVESVLPENTYEMDADTDFIKF